MLEHHVEALTLRAEAVPCRTKIKQFDGSAAGDVDIVRSDVAMDQPLLVDGAQRIHHRHEKFYGILPADGSAVIFQVRLQADSLDIFHHKIRGVVFFKITAHSYNIWVSKEFCQYPGLIEKMLKTIPELFSALSGINCDIG